MVKEETILDRSDNFNIVGRGGKPKVVRKDTGTVTSNGFQILEDEMEDEPHSCRGIFRQAFGRRFL